MRGLWQWLKRDAPAFKALAAIVVILGCLPWIYRQFQNWTSSDLKVYVKRTPQVVPSSQKDFADQLRAYSATIRGRHLTAVEASEMKNLFNRLRVALKSEGRSYSLYMLDEYQEDLLTLEKLRMFLDSEVVRDILYSTGNSQRDRMTITVVNQSGRAIDAVRIKPTALIGKPEDVSFQATFLNSQEASIFGDSLKATKASGNSVLMLPKIPPDSRIAIDVFGTFSEFGDPVQVIGEGISSKIVKIDDIPLEGVIGFVQSVDVYILLFFGLPIAISLVLATFAAIAAWGTRHSVRQLPSALVERARVATKDNRKQDAIVLLKDAQRIGYNDWDSLTNEKVFEPLKNMKGYRDLKNPSPSQNDTTLLADGGRED